METIARIRREFFVQGKTIKEIVRSLRVSRNTVRKVLRSGATAFAINVSLTQNAANRFFATATDPAGNQSLAWAAAWARRRLAALAVVLLAAAGCAPLRAILPAPEPDRIVCVAHYRPLVPGTDLGQDGCGNAWVRNQDGRCWFMPEPGIVVEVQCPAEGDTLYVGPANPEGR